MKTAVFGGSFDPIHNGHIELLRVCIRALQPDRTLVIPAAVSPFKLDRSGTSAAHRLEMCRLAFEYDESITVSDIEIKREGPSYTFLTLRELKAQDPEGTIFLITGADSFLTIQDWKNPEEIFRSAVIAAVPRNSDDIGVLEEHAAKLKALGAETLVLDAHVMTVSSTQVRDCVKNGEDISGLVPDRVRDYIILHGLYKS